MCKCPFCTFSGVTCNAAIMLCCGNVLLLLKNAGRKVCPVFADMFNYCDMLVELLVKAQIPLDETCLKHA